MFERYTEKARRAIFYGRLESSKMGGPCIESEHLLGLLAADKSIFARFLRAESSETEIREAIVRSTASRPSIPTSVDLPLSNESKRILAYGAEEADRLGHHHIDVDHLLLGTLREGNCFAARLLAERGLRLDQVRTLVVADEKPAVPLGSIVGSTSGVPGPSMAHVQFVEAGSQEPLLTHRIIHLVPRDGDKLILRKEGSMAALYRVQGVEWDFGTDAGSSVMKNVVVRVFVERATEPDSDPGSTASRSS
jgi:hypothetical protein